MLESYLRSSPLSQLGLAGRAQKSRGEHDGVAMGEVPFRGLVNLRLDPAKADLKSAAEGQLGIGLPLTVGDTAKASDVTVLCVGPNEWLLVAADGPDLTAKLKAATQGMHVAVTDISENWTAIRVSGPKALDLLAKGCFLDFLEDRFPVGHCAQSLMAKADATILRLPDGEDGLVFDIWVRISFAEYLWLWLEDAAGEYGLTVMEFA